MPSPCRTRTHSPNPLAGPESITVPANGTRIGVPIGAAMSRPSWRVPQRLPNPEVTRPVTIWMALPDSELVSAFLPACGRRLVARCDVDSGRRSPLAAASAASGRGLGRGGLGGPGLLGGRAGAGLGQLALDVGRLDQLGGVDHRGLRRRRCR